MEKPQVPLKCRLHLLSCWKAKLKTSKCNLSPLICSNHLLPPPSNQIWGTCKRPSQPTPISMKAPKATTFFTTPRAWFQCKEVVVVTRYSTSKRSKAFIKFTKPEWIDFTKDMIGLPLIAGATGVLVADQVTKKSHLGYQLRSLGWKNRTNKVRGCVSIISISCRTQGIFWESVSLAIRSVSLAFFI